MARHTTGTDPVSSVSKQKAQVRAPHAFAVFSLSSSFSFSHTLPLSFFPLHICSQAQLHPTVLLSALEMRHRLHTLALDLPQPLPCTYCTHTLEYIHVSPYTSVLYIRCMCTVQYAVHYSLTRRSFCFVGRAPFFYRGVVGGPGDGLVLSETDLRFGKVPVGPAGRRAHRRRLPGKCS